ncbi:MAG: ATP-binding cassette domain-containing protein, partial [Candidatus Poribacteria bacterium]|nr:ATP-binding cassette domain-containing protein [Candidatus Poribacteria bacterium]
MFELRNVSKRFGSLHAVKPLTLTVPAGSTTVLIGPSGCGKSTLLRLMIGLIAPDSGDVLFEDAKLTKENLLTQRRKMGYVIQAGGLFPP